MKVTPGRTSALAFTLLAGLALSLGATAATAQSAPDYKALLNTPDRSAADLQSRPAPRPGAVSRLCRRAPGHEGARYGAPAAATRPN